VQQLAAAFVTSQRRQQAAALQGRSELNNVTGTFNCTCSRVKPYFASAALDMMSLPMEKALPGFLLTDREMRYAAYVNLGL
jgi:hypothetical protein